MDANWRIELEAFMAGPVAALLRDGLVGAYAKHDLVRQVRKGIVARNEWLSVLVGDKGTKSPGLIEDESAMDAQTDRWAVSMLRVESVFGLLERIEAAGVESEYVRQHAASRLLHEAISASYPRLRDESFLQHYGFWPRGADDDGQVNWRRYHVNVCAEALRAKSALHDGATGIEVLRFMSVSTLRALAVEGMLVDCVDKEGKDRAQDTMRTLVWIRTQDRMIGEDGHVLSQERLEWIDFIVRRFVGPFLLKVQLEVEGRDAAEELHGLAG